MQIKKERKSLLRSIYALYPIITCKLLKIKSDSTNAKVIIYIINTDGFSRAMFYNICCMLMENTIRYVLGICRSFGN